MARIIFAGDHEEGNILSSIGLAKQLRHAGHSAYYVGVPDAEELIRREGFEFFSILGAEYPAGSKYSRGRTISAAESRDALCSLFFEKRDQLDKLMSYLNPDLLILPPYLSVESLLIHLRYGIQITHFRNAYCIQPRSEAIRQDCVEILQTSSFGYQVRSFLREQRVEVGENIDDLVKFILRFPQFVCLPPGYEECDCAIEENCIYIGPLVDLARNEEPFDWNIAEGREHLLFCSLGSQCDREREKSRRFFKTVLEAMEGQEQWFMVVSIGNGMLLDDFAPPPNVYILNWVSQVQMLSKVELMIVHGGMGTTRECILSNVPMLAYPLIRDQMASARAIARHNIGLMGNMDAPDAKEIRDQIAAILNSADIRGSLSSMRSRFLECEKAQPGIQAVEQLLTAHADIALR